MADINNKFCPKCRKTLGVDNFYKTRNLEKHPDGYVSECKKCMTMHVDNFNADSFLWILEEIDVPYVPEKWNDLLMKYGKDASSLTGLSIIGRYLATMNVKQFRNYRYKDTEHLRAVAEKKVREAMEAQGAGAAEIDQAIELSQSLAAGPAQSGMSPDLAQSFSSSPVQIATPADEYDYDLTADDKTYLSIKWGRDYKPSEWVQLEQLFEEMTSSYDIQAAGDINTLKLACKCSLKANQLLDINDIDGAQKMTKMYDGLMKSGKWTAAQNKAEGAEEIDSVGSLVAICEKEGFIPRYYVSGPQDRADRVIEDLQKYTYELITNESGLGTMIESALRQIEEEREKHINDADLTPEEEEDKLFDYQNNDYLTTEDYTEFEEFKTQIENDTAELFASFLDDEEEGE